MLEFDANPVDFFLRLTTMPASQPLNPFGLPDIGLFSTPLFADIDNDGDLDAFIGAENGDTLFFKNTGNFLSQRSPIPLV